MRTRRPTVLLVDDNEDNRLIYRAILRHHGFRVLAASDGETAVRAGQRLRPDLVLMDIDLPRMDGWTATAVLRSDPETRDIPVVALTARDSDQDRARAHELNCCAFLVKPCSPVTVASEVTRVFVARYGRTDALGPARGRTREGPASAHREQNAA